MIMLHSRRKGETGSDQTANCDISDDCRRKQANATH